MRTITDPQTVFLNNNGVVGDFARSQRYAVGSERFITGLLVMGAGVPVGQKLRCFATIKTKKNDGFTPVNIDDVIDTDNSYAPVMIMDLNDRIGYSGSGGLPLQAGKNMLFQIQTEGVSDIFFEIEGGGIDTTLTIRGYN